MEYPDQNPWFNYVKMLCLSKCFSIWLQIICSIILHDTEVKDTGLDGRECIGSLI